MKGNAHLFYYRTTTCPPVKTQHKSVVPWLLTSVPMSSFQTSCQLYSHLDLSWLPPKSKATTKHLPPSDNLTWTWTCLPLPVHQLLERPAASSWNYLLLLDSFLNPWHPPTRALYRGWWQGPPSPSLKLPFRTFSDLISAAAQIVFRYCQHSEFPWRHDLCPSSPPLRLQFPSLTFVSFLMWLSFQNPCSNSFSHPISFQCFPFSCLSFPRPPSPFFPTPCGFPLIPFI